MILKKGTHMKKILTLLACIVLVGCSTKTELIDVENDTSDRAAGLEYRDFESAARKMVSQMIGSGQLNKPSGGRYVLIVSRIANDTYQRIDVDQLSKKIRVELMNSGKVAVTTMDEDARVMQARQLRGSSEVNQATVAKKGALIAPELSLSGKINQREFIVSGKKRIEYIFSLSITDINTGLTIWEGEEAIIKSADKKAVTW